MEVASRRQVTLIGISLTMNSALVSLSGQIIGIAKMDAWMSFALAMPSVLLPLWLLSKVGSRFPGQDLFEILTSRFPIMGRVISAILIVFFYILLLRDLRLLTEFVNITLLPTTPIFMISLLIIASILILARSGIEVVGRMTELWLPLFLTMLVLVPILLFTEFDSRLIRPILDQGLGPPLQGSWYAVAYMGEVVALPFLFHSVTFRLRDGLLGLVIGTAVLMLVTLYTILSLGSNMAGKVLFPLYETVRLIRVTDFLDRFDMPLILLFMPVNVIKAAILLLVVSRGIKRIVPVLSMKEFIIPLGAWCFVSAFWFFRNSVQLYTLNRTWPVFAILCEIVLPCLFFLALRPRKDTLQPSGSGS